MTVSARMRIATGALLLTGVLALMLLPGCGSAEVAETPEPPAIATGEHDPAVWGKEYPEQYATWLQSSNERPAGKSAYKRGFDGGVMFDKLSEYPFMPLLFKGWGFGIDYNEPRGHAYMLIDQAEADPSRVKAGGACLTCKSPYAQDLQAENKDALFAATYADAVAMIPSAHRELGATCIDCHNNETAELQTRRWTVDAALADIGLTTADLSSTQERLMVCGQCHATYSVMKKDGASVDVDFPWEGGTWGGITVEDIIANLEEQPARLEWTQQVTGFKLGFIRHPDIEFFSAGSPHWQMGATCADCHMIEEKVGTKTVTNHDVMSPLKRDMKPCQRCHVQTADELRAMVIAIQDANLAALNTAGYKTATVAKLIEKANASLETSATDVKPRYDEAAAHYRQALYRVGYMGAENSVGFHNPAEGQRILSDAIIEADAAESILRELLASKGISMPAEVPLELHKYTDARGVKALGFNRDQYIEDPSGNARAMWPRSFSALLD